MKRIFVLSVLILFVVSVSIPAAAAGKRKNVFVGIGEASSEQEGLFLDIGFEKRFFRNFYGQFIFDYYNNPRGLTYSSDSYAIGFSLYGVYKIPVSHSINFFLKAGYHLTIQKDRWESFCITTGSDHGIAGGGGIEFHLSDRTFIYGGVTVKRAFINNDTWVKLYGGVGFRLK